MELEDWAREMLVGARVARLGLLDDEDRPRVLPVTFALVGDVAWSAIDHKPKRSGREPARLRYLRRRPAVALTVDRYDDDWSRLAWVQLLGTAQVYEATMEGEAMAALSRKYDQYRLRPPQGPLIAIEPTRALTWRAN